MVRRSTVPGTPHLYARNFGQFSGSILRSYLKDLPYVLSTEEGYPPMPGINIPAYYWGGSDSFTDLHLEDRALDSCNVFHFGTPGAVKLWLVIAPEGSQPLRELVQRCVCRLLQSDRCRKKEDRIYSCWGPECSFPLNHKNIFITPRLLTKYRINHEVVVQRPGDLIYVKEGIYHAVLNIGAGLAESVNVGSLSWNSSAHLAHFCRCRGSCINSSIKPNPKYAVKPTPLKCPAVPCNVGSCVSIAPSLPAALHHSSCHTTVGPVPDAYVCSLCRNRFTSQGDVLHHEALTCKNRSVTCVCGRTMKFNSLRRHLTNPSHPAVSPFGPAHAPRK